MDKRNVSFIPKCLAIAFKRKCDTIIKISGEDLFKRFVDTNNNCFWNINLKDVFDKCVLVGHVRPFCLLINAADLDIQSLKLAYEKRLLKAPELFSIQFMGDVGSVSCDTVTPSQFVPLDEALCYVIFDLNLRNEESTFCIICCRLAEWYPGLQLPPQFLILATLRNLVETGQVYFTGYGYSIMTTDRIPVAQWLGEQGLCDDLTRTNSLKEISLVDESDSRAPGNGMENNVRRCVASTSAMEFIRDYRSMCDIAPPTEQTDKKNKTTSAVRQFFAKFRRGNHKSHSSSLAVIAPNDDDLIDQSKHNSYRGSQPRFYSSNLECSSRFPMTTPSRITADTSDEVARPEWLWRPSLQSISHEVASGVRSPSSHSTRSTKLIQDESSLKVISSRREQRSKCKSNRNRWKHSLPSDGLTSEDNQKADIARGNVQQDSGIHSTYESSGNTITRLSLPHHHHKSFDFDSDQTDPEQESPTSSVVKHKTSIYRVFPRKLSRMYGTTSLDHVTERSRRTSHEDKHVAFMDNDDS